MKSQAKEEGEEEGEGEGEGPGVGDSKKNSGPMECRLLSTYQSDRYSASRGGVRGKWEER